MVLMSQIFVKLVSMQLYKCICLFYLLWYIHLLCECQICLMLVGVFQAIHFQIPVKLCLFKSKHLISWLEEPLPIVILTNSLNKTTSWCWSWCSHRSMFYIILKSTNIQVAQVLSVVKSLAEKSWGKVMQTDH